MSVSKALVILSGGQDSTTCLFHAVNNFDEVHAVTFDYGQRHAIELESARKVASLAGVDSHEFIRVGPILASTSPLVNSNYSVESYKDAESLPGGLEKTFVPGRNALFLILASNRAYALRCATIYIGVCEEDFGGYFDCRQDFITSMEHSLNLGLLGSDSDFKFELRTPLMHLTKKQSVELAQSLPGCMDALAYSHTCYNGGILNLETGHHQPCGKCHACLLRQRGFDQAGVVDPLVSRVGVAS